MYFFLILKLVSSRLVLNFFTDPTKPNWLGIFYAILLSITVFCQIILMRAHFQNQFVVGIRFRAAITGFVYRKVIYLSYVCHYLSMVFQTRNDYWRNYQSSSYNFFFISYFFLFLSDRWPLMLHDLLKWPITSIYYGQVCTIFLEICIYSLLHCLCCLEGPLQLIITLFLLYRQMQLAIIPGVALLFIMIPVNLFLQRIQKKLTVCMCM
jgi:hypothetical protein